MRISLLNVPVLAALAAAVVMPLQPVCAQTDPEVIALLKKMEARIVELESKEKVVATSSDIAMAKRIAELESRLQEQEQETKEVKVLATSSASGDGSSILGNVATFDILAGSAWRNLRWTHEDQWEGIERGVTEEFVIDRLGYPPRSVDSLKPRIDKVYWYETSLRDSAAVRGKISFKKGRAVSIEKPDFVAMAAARQEQKSAISTKQRRLP